MGFLNINSLSKHIDELRVFTTDNHFDVLAINETKLDCAISDQQISLSGYNCVRKDRNMFGGGVCMYINQSISYTRNFEHEIDDLEMISIEIRNPNSHPFLVATWYRPPKAPDEYFDKFEDYLNLVDCKYKEIYILGDLNCNTFNNSLDNHTSRLIDILDNYQFFQIIDEPTRVTQTTKSLIDHFITKSRENVILSGVYPLSISDHSLIFAVRKIGTPRGNPRFIESRSFKNFDQNKFKLDLQNANWPPIGSVYNANDYWSKWKSIFLEIVDKHAPCRTKKVRSRPSPWITSEIKKQMYSRDKLKKKAIKTNKPEIWDDYKKIKNNVNKAVKRTKKSFYRQEIHSKAGDCKGT